MSLWKCYPIPLTHPQRGISPSLSSSIRCLAKVTPAHWGSTSNSCLVNSHLPLVLSRNAEFERGKSVFIHGNLTLQSIVNKRRIPFRFVRTFMQGQDTESIFWHKQLEMGFGHWKFCHYLKNFCRETFVLLLHMILVSICCSPQPSICC